MSTDVEGISILEASQRFGFEMKPEDWEYMAKMEEMANASKEPMGKRQPGEKGMYERSVDRP